MARTNKAAQDSTKAGKHTTARAEVMRRVMLVLQLIQRQGTPEERQEAASVEKELTTHTAA
jgi:hypothetical protein